SSMVTRIDEKGVNMESEKIHASTVLWAAGVEVVELNKKLGVKLDKKGRVLVSPDLSLPDYPEIFIVGDQAAYLNQDEKPLPGIAPVAIQQGRFAGRCILDDINGKERIRFHYFNKGQMTTIGRSRAIATIGSFKFHGFFAWLIWLFVHIYFLSGFKNRLFVFIQWAWYYFSFGRGARLIIGKEWRIYAKNNERE
ncbi:MAG: FAD-dependent oxidoreductase, partial [Calditrichaceae bacterium]